MLQHQLIIMFTDRVLFAVVTLHLQTEYLFISFLLGASPLMALGVAYAVAFACWTVQLMVADRTFDNIQYGQELTPSP